MGSWPVFWHSSLLLQSENGPEHLLYLLRDVGARQLGGCVCEKLNCLGILEEDFQMLGPHA